MVIASGRWLGARIGLLTSLFIGAVALAAVMVSQDAGRYIRNNTTITFKALSTTDINAGTSTRLGGVRLRKS